MTRVRRIVGHVLLLFVGCPRRSGIADGRVVSQEVERPIFLLHTGRMSRGINGIQRDNVERDGVTYLAPSLWHCIFGFRSKQISFVAAGRADRLAVA